MEPILDLLIVVFRQKIVQLIENCKQKGVKMRPYFTLRDPYTQAKYWRQSRTTEEVEKKINELKEKNALFLANCIESVGKQYGGHVTNAIPGLSWHQWGEAVDCVWIVDGISEWSARKKINGQNGYKVYADEAVKLGLNAGFYWKKFQDSSHVQLRKASSPLVDQTIVEIDAKMKEKYQLISINP